MENPDESKSLSLKLVVEKGKNRVVFAEAGKDLVDVLLSFLTMPISTIINLCEGVEVGCFTNLYHSIQALDDQHFQSLKCKDMLLHPRSALELYCKDIEINFTQCEASYYYACGNVNCDLVSCYLSHSCRCGKPIELIVKPPYSLPQEEKGFIRPTARLMITDDFKILPMSTRTALTLLDKQKALDGSKIGERCMKIGRDEIVKMLKASVTSRTSFSNALMDSTTGSCIVSGVKYGPRSNDVLDKDDTSNNREKISLKLITYKSKALYAEVREDFVDLVFSFLTIPLGYVFKEFPYLSFKGCLGNLYNTTKDLDVNRFFLSDEKKEMMINPKLAPGLRHSKQLIGIPEATNPSYSTLKSLFAAKRYDLKPGEEEQVNPSEGFIKGPSMFRVTDDLNVTMLSVSSALSLIKRLKIPLTDIEEQEVTMSEDEALQLLAASFVSKNALTQTFILKDPNQEK